MSRTALIPVFAILLHSAAAYAQSEAEDAEGDWFGEQETAESPQSESPPSDEASAPAEQEKEPAKAAVDQTKAPVVNVSDPERDDTTVPTRKQGVRTHDGFYLRMSLGGGSVAARGYRSDSAGAEQEYSFEGNAVQGDLLIGGTPMPGLVLGGAYLGSYAARSQETERDGTDVGMSFGVVGPFIDIYPDPRGGLHLGGMLGPAASVTYDDRYEEKTAAVGFGGGVWVGYDFWIGDQWSLGGVLRASAARVETPPNRELLEERDRLGIASVALLVSATYH
jgi:hypothetical protein